MSTPAASISSLVGRRGRATMCTFQYIRSQMTTTISVRIDSDTKDQLAAVDRLAQMPNLGRPGRVPGTRELVVPGTRYVIPYRVRAERLEIIAVFHGRQRWPKRL